MTKIVCPAPGCFGNGYVVTRVTTPNNAGLTHITCDVCHGEGLIGEENALWLRIGATHRICRVANREGLAACAERLEIDQRDLNDMEHGRADPTPLLADIPEALRISENLQPPAQEAA